MPASTAPVHDHVNEVRLVGRVSADPTATVLPSGDEVITVRVIVERPRPPAGRGRKGSVDTVVCAVWSPSVRRRVRLWGAGDVVEVSGALRRRFWRSEAGPRSRYEVELAQATRLSRASRSVAPAGHVDDDSPATARSAGAETSVDTPSAGSTSAGARSADAPVTATADDQAPVGVSSR